MYFLPKWNLLWISVKATEIFGFLLSFGHLLKAFLKHSFNDTIDSVQILLELIIEQDLISYSVGHRKPNIIRSKFSCFLLLWKSWSWWAEITIRYTNKRYGLCFIKCLWGFLDLKATFSSKYEWIQPLNMYFLCIFLPVAVQFPNISKNCAQFKIRHYFWLTKFVSSKPVVLRYLRAL